MLELKAAGIVLCVRIPLLGTAATPSSIGLADWQLVISPESSGTYHWDGQSSGQDLAR